MNNSLPYTVLYSVGNQECKRCKKNIDAGSVQIAIMVQSNDDDCHFPEWFHMKCFFKIRLPKTEAAFDGFARLRYVDQTRMKMHLGTMNGVIRPAAKSTKLPDFGIEYTKTERDVCAGCQQKITKPGIRIMHVVHDKHKVSAMDGKAVWYHVICFSRSRTELGWLQSAESFPGFKRLAEEDKEMVLNQIPLISRELYKPVANVTNSNQAELDRKIELQNKEYYEMYDNLVKYVTPVDRVLILRTNVQFVPDSEYEILHHLTDVLYFGAMNPCNVCSKGELLFANTTYICSHITSWSKCGNDVKQPERREACICSELCAKYPFLSPILPTRVRELHTFRTCDEDGQDLVYGPYKHPILFNMDFLIIGNFSKSRQEIEKTIQKLGGSVVHVVHRKLAAVISNFEEVYKMGFQMSEARKFGIQVVSLDFLSEIQEKDPILYIISESICEWGGDPYVRIDQNVIEIEKDDEFYTKSLPQKIKFKSQNGCVVDPDSGLEANANVFCRHQNNRLIKYSVVMGIVDIENNKNSYYRIQLLQSNSQPVYWVFESWGRISTVIGSKKLTNHGESLDAALKHFTEIYKEKTGNNFGNIRFIKRPKKYYHLDIECGPAKPMVHTAPSQLSPSVHQLMMMLFDVNKMEKMMISCDLDLRQMPLGKLSANQIRSAMNALREISRLISKKGTLAQLRDASNKFYTLVPHGFSVRRPTIIDSLQVVNAKNEMLESLLNMELIYSYLDEETGKSNPLDACYLKLKTEITPVLPYSSEFQQLQNIIANTHGSTHKDYALELLDAFKIRREGEDVNFAAYDSLSNHQLLWHGSRLMNYVSILTNGLKVAPPEAPVTGYMFGKGIYFADVVSKSANYCKTDRMNNIGLMLLCEVALGKTHDLYFANGNITGIPNDAEQSVRACGATFPLQYDVVDGTYMASGQLTKAQFPTALHYNEFVVYDPAQVKIKYLVKMKFHFRP